MRKIRLDISNGDGPPSAESIAQAKKSVLRVKKATSELGGAGGILFVLCFIGHLVAVQGTSAREILDILAFAGAATLALTSSYESGSLVHSLAQVTALPDELLGQAVMLKEASAEAKKYCDKVRAQNRELTGAELEALQRLVAEIPPEVSRKRLYEI